MHANLIAPIPGSEGYYATRGGKILSTKGGGLRKLKQNPDGSGHLTVNLYVNGRNIRIKVHTAVMTAFVSNRPYGMQCRHIDGNKINNALSNLRWGTWLENANDNAVHGIFKGEKNPGAKLKDAQVVEIRSLRLSGWKLRQLAERFKVSISLCSLICSRRLR